MPIHHSSDKDACIGFRCVAAKEQRRYNPHHMHISHPSLRLICILVAATNAWFFAWNATAQIVISEILENPPGRGHNETAWEYIELYGAPGASLDHTAILVLKGGIDDNRDGVPEVEPHLAEVFYLDGFRLSEDGFFILAGVRSGGTSPIRVRCLSSMDPATIHAHVKDFSDAYPQHVAHQPERAHLEHDGSSTYLLVYIDPNDPHRTSLQPGALIDKDFDGKRDASLELDGKQLAWPSYQVLDELAWSHRGGQEYTLLKDNEISHTVGLNPDAVTRVRYYTGNPMRGHRTKDVISSSGEHTGFEVLGTSTADESFLFGVLDAEQFPGKLIYFDGYDLDGWDQLRGPTDRSRMPYDELFEDPEPDTDPFPKLIPRSPSGTLFFDDLRPQRFELTPGTFNDSGSEHLRQFRFIPGDINFDGRVDQADIDVARALSGATLRDRIVSGAPSGQDQYRWQCGAAQQIMALLSLTHRQNTNGAVGPEHVRAVESLAATATD